MIESRCGLLCSECGFHTRGECEGCVNIPKPFWGDRCDVKACCEERGLDCCGECEQFVCPVLHAFAYDMGEQSDNGARLEQCRKWRAERTGAANGL